MSTPSSVVGCSSCGALYTQSPGDRGLCSACRRLLVSDVPWRADAAGADPEPGEAPAPSPRRAERGNARRPSPFRLRAWRRLAIGAVVASIVGGLGVTAALRRKSLADSWTRIERHVKSDAFSSIRRRVSSLWTSVRHEGAQAWAAIRHHLPFDGSDGKSGDSIAPAATPRAGVREATASRGTQRRKSASAKRSRDD